MGEPHDEEQKKVISESIRQVDDERRTWTFAISNNLANLAFALAPLVPRSEHLFGPLTWAQALLLLLPGQLAIYVSWINYRRVGSEGRAYRISEAIESSLMFGSVLAIIFVSEVRWSPIWGLSPFTAIFWALTKPFQVRLYVGIIVTAHGATAALLLIRGSLGDSLVALLVGLVSLATFLLMARVSRGRILAEADRNVARAAVKEARLDAERERIARSLTRGIVVRLAPLVERLEARAASTAAGRSSPAKLAHGTLEELRRIAFGTSAAPLAGSLSTLGALVEKKLEAMCVEAAYEQRLEGAAEAQVSEGVALATIRIVQELVRNALTHGAATRISVSLEHDGERLSVSVRDDGKGLRAERLESATGGLENARRWAAEQGGSLQRPASNQRGGTELRVTMPAKNPSIRSR